MAESTQDAVELRRDMGAEGALNIVEDLVRRAFPNAQELRWSVLRRRGGGAPLLVLSFRPSEEPRTVERRFAKLTEALPWQVRPEIASRIGCNVPAAP